MTHTMRSIKLPKPDLDKLARILSAEAPADADGWKVVHLASTRWNELSTTAVGEIVHRAEEIRVGKGGTP